jgi:hypothetical protein
MSTIELSLIAAESMPMFSSLIEDARHARWEPLVESTGARSSRVGSGKKNTDKAEALPTGTDCHCGVHVYVHRKSRRKVIDRYDEGAGKMRNLSKIERKT